MIEYNASVELDKTGQLKNGEEISYKWTVDKYPLTFVDCKVKYDNGTYKVKDLEKAETFDAFKDLEVKFLGANGDGEAKVEYKGDLLEDYSFYIENQYGLKNGDEVIISLSNTDPLSYIDKLGKLPKETKKKYKVAGLGEYIEKLKDIPEDSLKELEAKAKSVYDDIIERSWGDSETLKSFTHVGNCLLTGKHEGFAISKNKLFLIYKMRVRNVSHNSHQSYRKTNTVYWYIGFNDVVLTADSKIQADQNNYDTPYETVTIDSGVDKEFFGTYYWYYDGYKSVDKLLENFKDSYNNDYNIESDLG